MSELDAVVADAAELVVGPDAGGRLDRRTDAAVAVVDGTVAAVGPTDAVTRAYPPENARRAVDAAGKSVVPGFVDAHTHALFAGDRSDEFEARLQGTSYQEILAAGGGILRTVRATRDADRETLLSNLRRHLDTMLAHGTTTVEVKSGYGLDIETERRMLAVLDRADETHPVDVVPTFMGAHAVPEGRDAEDYVSEVVDEQLPVVADQGVARFCDVFCEEGVFDVEQSRRVLEAGRDAGLTPKVHAEEFTHLGGARLAADVAAASADHLLHATPEDAAALVAAGVTPVFLPGTAFTLGTAYADPRPYLEAAREETTGDDATEAPIALATDFNPNCYSQSMSVAMALACHGMGLTPAEALVAATRGGARALDRPGDAGTLRPGAPADLLVLDAPSHVYLPYNFGVNTVETVLKGGDVVVEPEVTVRA